MKTKEHSRQLRDEAVEKFKAHSDYRAISQAFNFPQSSVQDLAIHLNPKAVG